MDNRMKSICEQQLTNYRLFNIDVLKKLIGFSNSYAPSSVSSIKQTF